MRSACARLAHRAASLLAEPATSTSGRTGAAARSAGFAATRALSAGGGGGAAMGRWPLSTAPPLLALGAIGSGANTSRTPTMSSLLRAWTATAGSHRSIHTSGPPSADGQSSTSPPPRSPSFVRLNSLAPAPGSTRPAKRVGRGIGSGRGKTSGRGHKGQKARSGATPKLGFEGGQTPLAKRLPKRGFVSPTTVTYTPVNVGRLQALVEAGRLDPARPVTMRDLVAAGAVSKKTRHGVKVLGRGAADLATPLQLEVSAISPAARAAVEGAGGTVTRVYYNALNLRALLRPGWLAGRGRAVPRPAAPPPKRAGLFDAVGVVPPEGGGGRWEGAATGAGAQAA